MMIVRDTEWILSEMDGRIRFLSRKDGDTELSCSECRFVMVERNLAFNLKSYGDSKERICFTNRTLRSFKSIQEANCTFIDALKELGVCAGK